MKPGSSVDVGFVTGSFERARLRPGAQLAEMIGTVPQETGGAAPDLAASPSQSAASAVPSRASAKDNPPPGQLTSPSFRGKLASSLLFTKSRGLTGLPMFPQPMSRSELYPDDARADLPDTLKQHVLAGFSPDLALDLVLNELVVRAVEATHASGGALALARTSRSSTS